MSQRTDINADTETAVVVGFGLLVGALYVSMTNPLIEWASGRRANRLYKEHCEANEMNYAPVATERISNIVYPD